MNYTFNPLFFGLLHQPQITVSFVVFISYTKLPVILKGILTHEDAKLALNSGCKGIIVSNHGARQIDTVPATIETLPEIVEAVGTQMPVMFDGGVRNGTLIIIINQLAFR